MNETWQPIATAPKDGSRVLAFRSGDEPKFYRWLFNPRTGTTFWNDEAELDCYEYENDPPTHWFPLPPVLNI